MTGYIHASRCVTQPIYATVTDNYAHEKTASDKFPEFSRINKFPEISMFSRVVNTLVNVHTKLPILHIRISQRDTEMEITVIYG